MKIDFVRSGGMAGMRLALTLDTESLAVEDAARIRQLVEASGFFEPEPESQAGGPGADQFEYQLTVDSQIWGRRTIVIAESAVDAAMRPLLDHLTTLAMHRGRAADSPRSPSSASH